MVLTIIVISVISIIGINYYNRKQTSKMIKDALWLEWATQKLERKGDFMIPDSNRELNSLDDIILDNCAKDNNSDMILHIDIKTGRQVYIGNRNLKVEGKPCTVTLTSLITDCPSDK